ncbi:uncharacterized protein BDR25DRAFT_340161 [Lindgomyces ingoldianus]|uniref:Uncharacterized protein n=1 Tax=Lindgomyces ingoldianus TaxID=673940 RepID=A0ACB6R8A9_9PLEO|nr:uncharacterized protein BDR25DRAFT_340161 [Lindgomyces ingoldianus]KAF2475391.1 hypothetical protein BDR25DRAFT_340161 [Lindgomyces ingoldianus]
MTQATNDPLRHLVAGYPKLAGQMGIMPEAAMFRTFSALNARNLLYLQAELISLEKQLLDSESNDSQDEKRSRYALDWFWLSQSKQNEGNESQLQLILEMRKKLKEYNKALIQASTLANLKEPDKWDLNYLQGFLMTKEMGSLALIGDDATTWGSVTNPKGYSTDLVALRPRQNEDSFSNWVSRSAVITLFRCGCARFKKASRVHGDVGFEDSTIFRITSWFTSIVASLIPIASILVLYTVHSMKARLGIIAGFNLLISTCLSTLTNAKRSEIFAVTAAFAAVQVVFVGTNYSASTNGAEA